MPPGGFLTMGHLDTLEARMTNHVKRDTGEDRSIGSGSRSTPGEATTRHGKREAGEGEKNAGGSRGQLRQSAAAASFPLDYRFSVL
jgi:hypothetical protein